jgi:regulator of protease activity HflC (stomatin/prohibitin superfamily)
MIPLVDRMQKVTLRTVTKPIQSQAIITKDNVSVAVAAVAYYRRVDPVKSIVEIENVESAIDQIAQTTVRNVVGRSTLDRVLSETETLNESIKQILDVTTERWGVLVELVELKDIQLPDSMKRAMAREAEAEREKRAKIIAAEGEALSAAKLGEAADVIDAHPIALQLRNLQVLGEIAAEKNSTIIFPAQFLDSVRAVAQFVEGERSA